MTGVGSNTDALVATFHQAGDLLEVLPENASLCVATDLTLSTESIRTQSVARWRGAGPVIGKRPTVFLLLSG